MKRSDSDQLNALTLENHLERDHRLNMWSVGGIGADSHKTEDWVELILSISLPDEAPNDLSEIFERARAVIVYGCYHYPLFTLGFEELLRYHESLLKFALGVDGLDKNGRSLNFASLIDKAVKKKLISDHDRESWHAARELRNSTSHNETSILLGPNQALNSLVHAQVRTEALISSST